MSNKKYKYLLFGILMIVLNSCQLEKAFDALSEYNYFEAKKQFEKALKRNQSPSAYGLSIIYFRNDNPFHNQDSAYHYGLLAVESYNFGKVKKQEKWKEKFDYHLNNAILHRENISDFAYQIAAELNSISAYQNFIINYPWSDSISIAIKKRDSLAYELVQENPSSHNWEKYMKEYPESEWIPLAEENRYEAQYHEIVREGDIESYIHFVDSFEIHPFLSEAHEEIYTLATSHKTIEEYEDFITRFPHSPQIERAWLNLYRKSIPSYSIEKIEAFEQRYPDFPLTEVIEKDKNLVDKELFLVYRNDKYGFMNEQGILEIPIIYESAGDFSDGLSLVVKEDKYGYINKGGDVIIDFLFDDAEAFHNGRAVVEKDDLLGIIDRAGNFILQPQFEEIGSYSEGLIYALKEGAYQFYNLDGKIAFSDTYDEAFSFSRGLAQVRFGDTLAYINNKGIPVIKKKAQEIKRFTDSLFVVVYRDSSQLVDFEGSALKTSSYDYIGIVAENRAIVEKDGKYGYIDSEGNEIISIKYIPFPNYRQFGQFEEGHALIKKGNLYALIDLQGREVLPALFSGIGGYGELIPVMKEGSWGYCNDKAQLKIPYQYDFAYPFRDKVAIVESRGFEGLINQKGEELLAIDYHKIKYLDQDYLLVEDNGKVGLYTKEGKQVLPIEYDKIYLKSKELIQLIIGEEIKYFVISIQKIIALDE